MPGLKKGIDQIKMQKGGSQSANSVSNKDKDELKKFYSGLFQEVKKEGQPYIKNIGGAMKYIDKADKDTIKNLTKVMEEAKARFNRGPDGLRLKKGKQKGNKMQDGGTKRRTLKEAVKKLEEKTTPPGKGGMPRPTSKGIKNNRKRMDRKFRKLPGLPGKMVSDKDVDTVRGMMLMKEGGKVTEFGKAFAKARKKFLADKGPSVFTFKGKKYNVQTKEDRKTVVKKVSGGRKASERKGKAITKFPQVRAASERKGKAITKVDSPVRRKVPMVSKLPQVRAASERKGKAIKKVDSPVRRKVPMVSKDELKKLSPVKRISLPKIKATAQRASKRGLTSKQAQSLGLTEDKRRPSNRAKKRGKVREIIAKVTGMSQGGTFKGTF